MDFPYYPSVSEILRLFEPFSIPSTMLSTLAFSSSANEPLFPIEALSVPLSLVKSHIASVS
jgi:hypothetical protein